MKKILITGANGLLGQALLNNLNISDTILATGIEDNLWVKPHVFEYRILDITDFNSSQMIIHQFKPDFIVNAASYTHVDNCENNKDNCWEINVKGVENLAKLAKENNAFLIHYSTDFIFDGLAGPYTENDTPHPLSYCGKSKLASETTIHQIKGKYSILRTCVLYGIGQDVKRNFFLWLYESLKKRKIIQVVTDQYNNPTLVEDLVDGTRLIIERGSPGIFHIAGADYLSRYDFACELADIFGFNKKNIMPISTVQLKQKAIRPLRGGLEIEYARSALNYNPLSVRNSLVYLKSKLETNDY